MPYNGQTWQPDSNHCTLPPGPGVPVGQQLVKGTFWRRLQGSLLSSSGSKCEGRCTAQLHTGEVIGKDEEREDNLFNPRKGGQPIQPDQSILLMQYGNTKSSTTR